MLAQSDKKKLKSLKKEANALFEQGDYRTAIKLFTEIIESDNEDFEIVGKRGVCYMWTAKPKKAKTDLDLAIKHNPEASLYFSRFAIRPYTDVKGKVEDLDEAIKLDPTVARYHYERAYLKYEHVKSYVEEKEPGLKITRKEVEQKYSITLDNICEDFSKAAALNIEYAEKSSMFCTSFNNAFIESK